MELSKKEYKTIKTRNYIKTNHLFFFFNGVNQKNSDWIINEQKLKNMNFDYYKIFNKTTLNTVDTSIYKNIKTIINGITLFIKPSFNQKSLSRHASLSKHVLLNKLDSLLLIILAIKLNNKIYSANQLKNTYSLNYKNSKLIFYQFGSTNLKFYQK